MSGFVEHGRTIWELALIALVGLGALAPIFGPPLLARLRAFRARRSLGAVRTLEGLAAGMVVTLSGSLRARGAHHGLTGEAARTAHVGRGRRRSTTLLRTDEVQLVVGSATVDLVGPIEILSGGDDVAVRSGGLAVRTRSVRPGDQVRVRGAVETIAGEPTAAAYRTAAHRFRLVPASQESPRLRLACETRSYRVTGRARRALRGAAAGAAGFVALFVLGGALATALALRHSSLESDPALRPGWGLSPVGWAAATPLHRPELWETVERAMAEFPRASLVEATAALARPGPDCLPATRALAGAGELRRAARSGEACDDAESRREAARAWLLLAEYSRADRAFRALPLSLREDDRARPLAAELFGPRPSPWTVRDEDRCLLIAVAAARGTLRDKESIRDYLRRALRDGGVSQRACAVLLATRVEGRDREEVLAGAVEPADPLSILVRIDEDPLRDALVGEEAASAIRGDAATLAGAAGLRNGLSPAFEAGIHERLTDAGDAVSPAVRHRRAWLAADIATIASLAGDHRRARAIAPARVPVDGALDTAACLLSAAIELRAGAPEAARRHLSAVPPGDALGLLLSAEIDAATGGDATALLALAGFAPRGPARRAADGDGRALSRWLAQHRTAEAVGLHLLVARVRRGREPLRAWIRWGGHERAATRAIDPLENLVWTSRQLDLARAVGDDELADELAGTLRRLSTLLSNRELSLAIALAPSLLR